MLQSPPPLQAPSPALSVLSFSNLCYCGLINRLHSAKLHLAENAFPFRKPGSAFLALAQAQILPLGIALSGGPAHALGLSRVNSAHSCDYTGVLMILD